MATEAERRHWLLAPWAADAIQSLIVVFKISWQLQDTMNRRRPHIPAFGNWDYSSDLPITQYFESAMQAGLVRGHFRGEETSYDDLFKASHGMKRQQEVKLPGKVIHRS